MGFASVWGRALANLFLYINFFYGKKFGISNLISYLCIVNKFKTIKIMEEVRIELTLYKTEEGYGIWLSDNIGGSGIKVEETTKEKAAESIAPYIEDYLYNLD